MDGAASGGEETTSQASDELLLTLQIYVPELVVQKCMQFNREEIIWDVKNQILTALPKELKEGFNYGLFCPPVNGRAGRFLDEERPLMDYPFTENNTYVELRYKRRIYKMSMEEKQLKQLHSRANLRRLLDRVHNSHVEKITKMCLRGLDPNFHCQETGESPLTLATSLKHPAKVIMALVNGGAHLDFRTKDGCTVLHKAVEKNNLEALRTLLDLGSSPNYKDSRGLTTLYYSVVYNSDPQLTEMLLHDHAMIGTADPHGWQEVHQACKYGLVQHLEHLLYYGADMNARNASGNTPLHVCAVNDQESCARVLLFRGADKNALNYANQNPHQVAVIAGNLRLAEIIKNHKPEDVVPYREAPKYNPRRRTSTANMGGMSQNHSDPRLELVSAGKPPSPCPSNHSLPHMSSGSDGGTQNATNGDEQDDSGVHSGTLTDTSETTGVGANSSGTDSDPFDSAKTTPLLESVCVCIEEYNPSTSGHLQLAKGDLLEVLAVSGSGYLEGRRRDGEEGLFPAACVQEMVVRCADTLPLSRYRTEGRRSTSAGGSGDIPKKWKMFGDPRTVVLHKGKKGFGFILRGAKAAGPLMERQPTEFWPSLQYLDDVDKGGVAEMAGLKKGDFLLEINGLDVSRSSHEHVVAIIRQSGDLVSMTVVTVVHDQSSFLSSEKPQLINRQCATLPRKLSTKKAPLPPKRDPKTTLSVGRARARSMVAGLAEIEVLDHTLNEYDSEGRSTKSSSIESIPNKPSTVATPDSTPSTTGITPMIGNTTSQNRTRPGSRVISLTELEDFFARHSNAGGHPHCGPVRNKYATVARIHRMKKDKKTSRAIKDDMDYRVPKNYSSTPELTIETPGSEELWLQPSKPKRSRSAGDVHFSHTRHCARRGHKSKDSAQQKKDRILQRQHSIPETSRSHGKLKERSSTPEIQGPTVIKQNGSDIYAETVPVVVKGSDKNGASRASCPPPSYPPPPPPVGTMIKVDISRGEYANATLGRPVKSTAVMSSFRPSDSAKLYASPDAITAVGYKREHLQLSDITLPRPLTKGNSLRSHSLPPKMPQNAKSGNESGGRSTGSLDTDYSSGDSTTGYTPSFKTSHRSREPTGNETPHQSDKRGTLRKVKSTGAKLPLGVNESSSPKNHDHFIQEPDYESSEEEATSAVDNKSGMVTFRAVDNQNEKGSSESPKASEDSTKEQQLNSKNKSSKSKEKNSSQSKNCPAGDNHHKGASGMVLSEETGERIFLGSDKKHKQSLEKSESIGENAQTKSQKVPPVPPPKSKQECVSDKEGQSPEQTLRRSGGGSDDQEKQNFVPFKATIFLKQTEVINKDVKENVIKSKDITLQHGKQDAAHVSEKLSNEEIVRDDSKTIGQKVKSPPQTLQKPTKPLEIIDTNAKDVSDIIHREKLDAASQKVAPVVPKKPKVDDGKSENSGESSGQEQRKSLRIEDQVDETTSVEMSSKSVKENIYNFEKQSQQASVKTTFSPRRKSDVIRITLIGSQKGGDLPPEKSGYVVQTMKTSKSCPKTFEDEVDLDDGPSLTAILASEVESQVTHFSAETPTITTPAKEFPDDWRRPGVLSPVFPTPPENTIKKTLEPASTTRAKSTASTRKSDTNSKENTLCRRSSSNNIEVENGDADLPYNGSSAINRLGYAKSSGNIHSIAQVSQELDAILATTTVPKSTGLFNQNTFPQGAGTPTSRPAASVFQNSPHAAGTPTSRLPPSAVSHAMMQPAPCQSTLPGQKIAIAPHSVQGGIPNYPLSNCIPPHTIVGHMSSNPPTMHGMPQGMVSHDIRMGMVPNVMQPPHIPPHNLQPTVPPHANQPIVPPHAVQPGVPRHSVPHGVPTHLMQPGIPPHSSGMMGGGIPPLTAYSQSPAEHPHTYNLAYGHNVEPNRRVDHEQLVNCIKTRDMQDYPYYVVSPSQPSKPGPMSAQARLLDNRHIRAPPPSNKVPLIHAERDDDVCLRLCEQVDKSLQLIRLQVDSLGMAAANEPEVLTELVPPPPEFNFASGQGHHHGHPPQHAGQQPNVHLHIAPPPEFSDESLARQRRAQMPQGMMTAVPQQRMGAPPLSTMDNPISRRTVPPDSARYPYPEHAYRGHMQAPLQDPRHAPLHHPHHQQQQQQHHQQQHSIPNNVTSSPVKTMTMTRSGYPTHNIPQQQPIRYESNCNTFPHPGARMVMLPPQPHAQQQQQHHPQQAQQQRIQHSHQRLDNPYPPGTRMVREDPQMLGNIPPPPQPQKEFRQKALLQWNMRDVSDWLESLFLPEYKICFAEAGITGSRLANMDNNDLMGLGVKQAGHRLNMERSIKWYLK